MKYAVRWLRAALLAGIMGPSLEGAVNFLVKLRTDLDTALTAEGTPVEAVVIAPENLRGGIAAGVVRESRGNRLRLEFQSVRFSSTVYAIHGRIQRVVNSKGNRDVDDLGQPVQIVDGAIVTPGKQVKLDEGAELRFVSEQVEPWQGP